MKHVSRISLVVCLSTVALLAQDSGSYWAPMAAPPNSIIGAYVSGDSSSKSGTRQALISKTDVVFPHLAMGGGWETVMVIVNMSDKPMEYKTFFYSQSGRPMSVTFRNYPQGQVVTDSAIVGLLLPGSSFNFALFDTGGPTQVG